MRLGALAALSITLAGCADPHFIHDPQIGFFRSSEIAPLLKSLRCELATYVAANNQHHIINEYIYPKVPIVANTKYAFFPIDPSKWGGISLELKIQDTLGTQSGTSFDWKRTPADGIHTKVWHIAPTIGEQNSYDLLGGFLIPQDVYGLDTSDRYRQENDPESDSLSTSTAEPYFCYKEIPRQENPVVTDPRIANAVYVQQDLDGIADGTKGVAQFTRMRVNAGLPLAAWLQRESALLTSTSLVHSNLQQNEAMLPGQQTYTFIIQATAGLDLRNTIASSLWTGVGVEGSGGFQQTGTLTIVLNGGDATNTASVKSGNAGRTTTVPLKPTTRSEKDYCDRPTIGQPSPPNKYCYWPPSPPKVAKVTKKRVVTPPSLVEQKKVERKVKPQARKQAVKPAFRDFGEHGQPIYPVPLSSLGGQ